MVRDDKVLRKSAKSADRNKGKRRRHTGSSLPPRSDAGTGFPTREKVAHHSSSNYGYVKLTKKPDGTWVRKWISLDKGAFLEWSIAHMLKTCRTHDGYNIAFDQGIMVECAMTGVTREEDLHIRDSENNLVAVVEVKSAGTNTRKRLESIVYQLERYIATHPGIPVILFLEGKYQAQLAAKVINAFYSLPGQRPIVFTDRRALAQYLANL